MADYKNLVLFLSTDKHPSPFDALLMYDAGADSVLLYGNVSKDEVKTLIQDAMFPRGPGGAAHTVLFIGGGNADLAEEIFNMAKSIMFPPFQLSTVADPRGAYTTSAALVAKVEDAMENILGMKVESANVVVLGGGGRVGRYSAYLLAKSGAFVTIADIFDTSEIAANLNAQVGSNRIKTARWDTESKVEVCKEADVIISAGPAGIQLISKEVLEKLPKLRLVADVNAVPPEGVEGLKAKWDANKEVVPNVLGIGSLAIGDIKLKTEKTLIKNAINTPGTFFGLDEAFEIAKAKVAKKKK